MARGIARPAKTIHSLRWAGGNAITALAQTAGSSAAVALASGAPRETVMRTRGEVLVMLDAPSDVNRGVLVSMGLVLMPQGQGTTVIWDPFGDSEAPWFWYPETFLGYDEYVTDVIDGAGGPVSTIVVDSKAMRKANVDEEIQFVVTNTTVNGAQGINVLASFRFLIGH